MSQALNLLGCQINLKYNYLQNFQDKDSDYKATQMSKPTQTT